MADESHEYNPLDYANLTRNCVEELMKRGPYALPLEKEFTGAGVYALFYGGDFTLYSSIRSPNAQHPIYVGKAIPAGARTGRKAADGSKPGKPLYGRLQEHAESIQLAAGTLRVEDFRCRYLVVTPLWITMAERFLIEDFQPLWNIALDGFGNHDPGQYRAGIISWWDLLHPGRSDTWTGRPFTALTKKKRKRGRTGQPGEEIEVTTTRTVEEARERVEAFLTASPNARRRMAEEAAARRQAQEGGSIDEGAGGDQWAAEE
ncbi:MAG: Eco29kI family restriction endonuclease [Chloroflexota bacterium]